MKDKSIERVKKNPKKTENLKFERPWISPKKPPMHTEEQLQQRRRKWRWRGERARETEGERRADPKRVLSQRWRDYILSPARPRQPGRSRPARPVLIEVFFSPFSFGSLLFFFQCLGNSLVTWGRSWTTNYHGAAVFLVGQNAILFYFKVLKSCAFPRFSIAIIWPKFKENSPHFLCTWFK
jgi:hypothetical protein